MPSRGRRMRHLVEVARSGARREDGSALGEDGGHRQERMQQGEASGVCVCVRTVYADRCLSCFTLQTPLPCRATAFWSSPLDISMCTE